MQNKINNLNKLKKKGGSKSVGPYGYPYGYNPNYEDDLYEQMQQMRQQQAWQDAEQARYREEFIERMKKDGEELRKNLKEYYNVPVRRWSSPRMLHYGVPNDTVQVYFPRIRSSIRGGASQYVKAGKKEILGKSRVIYKKKGSKKEYVKSKGKFIKVSDYKNMKK
jgi:hypothetical protein